MAWRENSQIKNLAAFIQHGPKDSNITPGTDGNFCYYFDDPPSSLFCKAYVRNYILSSFCLSIIKYIFSYYQSQS